MSRILQWNCKRFYCSLEFEEFFCLFLNNILLLLKKSMCIQMGQIYDHRNVQKWKLEKWDDIVGFLNLQKLKNKSEDTIVASVRLKNTLVSVEVIKNNQRNFKERKKSRKPIREKWKCSELKKRMNSKT